MLQHCNIWTYIDGKPAALLPEEFLAILVPADTVDGLLAGVTAHQYGVPALHPVLGRGQLHNRHGTVARPGQGWQPGQGQGQS